MTSIFVVAGFISITFLLAKFLEMRYIEKESKPLKLLIRDAFLVYFSVIISHFIHIDVLKNEIQSLVHFPDVIAASCLSRE